MHYQIWPFARASLRTREPLSCAIDDLGALIALIRSHSIALIRSCYTVLISSANETHRVLTAREINARFGLNRLRRGRESRSMPSEYTLTDVAGPAPRTRVLISRLR